MSEVQRFLHSTDWNYFWYPILNIGTVTILMVAAAERTRERNKWRREAERLQALIEQLAKERR